MWGGGLGWEWSTPCHNRRPLSTRRPLQRAITEGYSRTPHCKATLESHNRRPNQKGKPEGITEGHSRRLCQKSTQKAIPEGHNRRSHQKAIAEGQNRRQWQKGKLKGHTRRSYQKFTSPSPRPTPSSSPSISPFSIPPTQLYAGIHITLPNCMLGYTPPAPLYAGIHTTPVNKMTDRCKNITFPQTSVGDSNNVILASEALWESKKIQWQNVAPSEDWIRDLWFQVQHSP